MKKVDTKWLRESSDDYIRERWIHDGCLSHQMTIYERGDTKWLRESSDDYIRERLIHDGCVSHQMTIYEKG